MKMNNNLPCIILVEPQLAENVGMAARAMMNCGLEELRLVKPRENHIGEKAISASSNAEEILYNAIEVTKNNTGVHLQIAFNYGARDEIITATQKLAEKFAKGEIQEITEENFSQQLYTANMPDPDLLIRTGGEIRVSNYLLWQIAYSEILIIKEFWPEFDGKTLAFAVQEFHNRHRRYGK